MTERKPAEVLRICLSCRQLSPRRGLVRLTVDYHNGTVVLDGSPSGKSAVLGRSVYLCRKQRCLQQALKGNRLKIALQGGRGRKEQPKRQIKWPLESSLIHTLTSTCTES